MLTSVLAMLFAKNKKKVAEALIKEKAIKIKIL